MKILFTAVLLTWASLSVADGSAAAPGRVDTNPVQITLVYSGNLDGELEPCGCTEEGNLGGLRRRVTVVDRLRASEPGIVLVSAGGLISSYQPHEKLTAEFVLRGMELLNYDAIAVQWGDLAYGGEFLRPFSLPWVSSNHHDGVFEPSITVPRGTLNITVTSWLDPLSSPARRMPSAAGAPVGGVEAAGALHRLLERARKDGHMTVVASTLPLAEAREQFPMELIDVLMIRAAYEHYGEPLRIGRTLVLQPGSRGMRLGRVDLTWQDGAIGSFEHQVIAMPSAIPDAPRTQQWYSRYNERVKAAYEEEAKRRKAVESGQSPYAGATACQACHKDAAQAWQASRHSDAYFALVDVNKAFDPACIGCHTVGFREPGGFIDPTVTEHLQNVQCESCHGGGRRHVESAGATPVVNVDWEPVRMCRQCHIPQHSPSFEFSEYWPKIAH